METATPTPTAAAAPRALAGHEPEAERRVWQREFEPNLTGTAVGYRPAGHDYAGGQRHRAPGDYEAWSPDADPPR